MKAASCGEDLDGLLKLKEIYISMSNGVIGMSVASIVISSAVIYLVRLEKEQLGYIGLFLIF